MTDINAGDARPAAQKPDTRDPFAAETSFRPFGPVVARSAPGLFTAVSFRPFPGGPGTPCDFPADPFWR